MRDLTIYLLDLSEALVDAWTAEFERHDRVIAKEADFFSQEADAMVSPANSFGYMDGGLDLAIRHELGMSIQEAVQARIRERHHGELPVGSAEVVETGSESWPFLVCAPTMRVPENISHTIQPYLAFRAILLSVQKFNSNGDHQIKSILCPGLGTGVGRMPPGRCAAQMRLAYESILRPARIPGFQEIHNGHIQLLTT